MILYLLATFFVLFLVVAGLGILLLLACVHVLTQFSSMCAGVQPRSFPASSNR